MDNDTDTKPKLPPLAEAAEACRFEVRLLRFLEQTPFMAELSRHIRKVPTRAIPTAGVSYKADTDDIVMYYNPEFVGSLTDAEFNGLMVHEFYHLLLQHVTTRRRTPHRTWNIAGDLAINSLIIDEVQRVGPTRLALPSGGLIPGRWPTKPDGRELSEDEKKGAKLAALIASMPLMETSEFYFEKLAEAAKEERSKCPKHGDKDPGQPNTGDPGAGGQGDESSENDHQETKGSGNTPCTCGEDWADGFDDHSGWDDLSEEQRTYVEARVKDAIEKAAKVANQRADGWGSIPATMRERINAYLSTKVDWRSVLRNFVGSVVRANKSSSMKRINRRYPYIHPGTKKSHLPKLLVAIDMSGSVGDEALELFFGELNNLTRQVSITVAPFDTAIDDKDVFEWRKGAKVQAQRVRCGGTDFNAPTAYANDPKNRGRWDGLLVLTDGMAPQPEASRIKRAWVLAPGTDLEFSSSEARIYVEPPAQR